MDRRPESIFKSKISAIIDKGWSLQKSYVTRESYEKKITLSIIQSMGFKTEEYFRWIADDAEWRRYSFPLNENSVVIDGGGYDGKWAQEIFKRYKCEIHIFEPVKQFYDNIVELFKGNEKVKIYNVGMSDKNEKSIISVSGDSSSVFSDNGDKTYIQLVDVNEWLHNSQLKNIDLCKLNLEGSEYKILMSMVKEENMTHLLVDRFLIQFHRFPEHYDSMYEAIHNEFKKSHNMEFCYEFVWEGLKRK